MKIKFPGSYGLHPKKIVPTKKQPAKDRSCITRETCLENHRNKGCEAVKVEKITLIKAATQWQFGDWTSLSKLLLMILKRMKTRESYQY